MVYISINAQRYDLIVRSNGDSIFCKIDSITDTKTFFQTKRNGAWFSTHLYNNEIQSYEESPSKKKKNTSSINETCIRQNSIYFELGGTGAFWTLISYDRLIPIKDHLFFIPKIGISYIGFTYPVYELNLAMGGNKHFFETGFGQYMFFETFPERDFMLRAGYRYHGAKGFMVRVAPQYYQVYWPDQEGNDNKFWFGMSFGYCF